MSTTPAAAHAIDTLRAWFEMAPDAMLAVDHAGRVVLANAQAEGMFGYAAAALDNLQLDVLLPREPAGASGSERPQDPLAPQAWTGATLDARQGRRRDGQMFAVEAGVRTVTSDVGIISILSLRNVSATGRARHAALRARHDAFATRISRLVLESPDYESAIGQIPELVAEALEVPAVAILSSGRHLNAFAIRSANGLSATSAEVLTSIFGDGRFIHHAFEGGERDPVTTDTVRGEAAAIIRAGLAQTRYGHFALVPLFGRYEPLGILIALAPVEEAFDRDKVAFLQSMANLLTATVQRNHAEEQLAHAQRLDAVGQLTGGIAHDFNNLLTVVSGNLQLLEAELTDRPQASEIIDGALRAVDRGAELTRKLLTFARRQSLQPRAVQPRPLLTDLGRLLVRTLGEAVSIRIECTADVPAVYADPGELETALVNLALNARDAMPRGGRLTITARAVALETADSGRNLPPGRYVAFKVDDTGSGMAPDVRARAVEPFFTTKGAGKGSGLGLSMVYGFVTQSGGCVTVDSQLGYGTRVEFLLPTADKASPSPLEQSASSVPEGGATILVVEDEAEVRRIAATFLRDMGYVVLTAASAMSALHVLAAQRQIELLFSDVVLGDGMTGVELAEEARRLYPGLAVLLASGYPGVGFGSPAADATAAFPMLRKPYRREQLAGAVRAALDAT